MRKKEDFEATQTSPAGSTEGTGGWRIHSGQQALPCLPHQGVGRTEREAGRGSALWQQYPSTNVKHEDNILGEIFV